MHAGFFDVLHDAVGDQDICAVAEGVYIYFGSVVEEAIDEHGAILREGDGFAHVLADHLLVVGDHHGASAEHIAGAHEHGSSDAGGDGAGFFGACCAVPFSGQGISQVVEEGAEALADLRRDRCPPDQYR